MSDAGMAVGLISGIAIFLGLIFFTFGYLRGRMTRSWTQTTGIVVDRRDGRTSGIPALYPTFRWRDQNGQDHQRTSWVRASLGPRPGKQVPVKFDPANPDRAVIDSTVQSGRIFIGIGIGIAAVGLIIGVYAIFFIVAMGNA